MPLEYAASTDFVLLRAEWPATRGRVLAQSLRPARVIIKRHAQHQDAYYLLDLREALALLEAQPAETVGEALRLNVLQPLPAHDVYSSSPLLAGRCIVLRRGQVIGYVDPAQPGAAPAREAAPAVDRHCASCGAPAAAGDAFCDVCGDRLPGSAEARGFDRDTPPTVYAPAERSATLDGLPDDILGTERNIAEPGAQGREAPRANGGARGHAEAGPGDQPLELAEPPGELAESPGELAESPGELAESPGELAEPPGELAEPPGETDAGLPYSLQAEFPQSVALGQTAALIIALLREAVDVALAGGHLPLPLQLPAGAVIDILVQARRGFSIEGSAQASLTPGVPGAPQQIHFTLRATQPGPGEIRVLVFNQGVSLGALTVMPMVSAPASADEPGLPGTQVVPLAQVVARPPDLALLIEEDDDNGQRGFCMRITAANPDANLHLTKFGPVPFQIDPGPYFEAFYRDIEDAPPAGGDQASAVRRLAAKGAYLFEQLVPAEARRRLWELKDQISSVLIISEEPWIPWELCRLVGEQDGQRVEDDFLCAKYAMTRWIPGPSPRPVLTLRNMALVMPQDSGLPSAAVERSFLLALASAERHITEVPARSAALYSAFQSGQYDAWHFTGHGKYRGPDPDRSAMHLEQDDVLTAAELAGEVARLGRARPLVFLNACQIGRGGMSLTGIGGWAQQFLRAGASAFIGAHWSVFDQPAARFAEELYGRLLNGTPIGQAAQQARLAIRSDADPTWLAYTVFADPFAAVQA